jgi:hypothetical protein
MATGGLDPFLRAEEEANSLVEVLKRLKEETESYKTAREALNRAAVGVSELSTRCAEVAERLGGVAGTLRSIGTAELLRGLKWLARSERCSAISTARGSRSSNRINSAVSGSRKIWACRLRVLGQHYVSWGLCSQPFWPCSAGLRCH